MRKYNEEMNKKGYKFDFDKLSNEILDLPAPQRWKPIDEFAEEKASETFSNVALHAYQEFTKLGHGRCTDSRKWLG